MRENNTTEIRTVMACVQLAGQTTFMHTLALININSIDFDP